MKRVYAQPGRAFVMLILSLLIFMTTVPVGNGFYDRKKAYLKTNQLRRGPFKWARGSGSGRHQDNQSPLDNTNIKRVKVANGLPITAWFRKYTLADSGSSRSKRGKGKVQSCSELNFPILRRIFVQNKAIENGEFSWKEGLLSFVKCESIMNRHWFRIGENASYTEKPLSITLPTVGRGKTTPRERELSLIAEGKGRTV